MHRLWQIPELLTKIVSFLPAPDINHAFSISHHFRTILKQNLPAHLRPFPDHSPSHPTRRQPLPQDVRAKATALSTQDAALREQLKMTDMYFHWLEGARYEVLSALKPCLHPVLGEHATRLIDGSVAVAEGRMNVCLQTDIPCSKLHDLVHGKGRQDDSGCLAVGSPRAATVFCLRALSWDQTYAGVQTRDCGAVKGSSVRIEREAGVRMSDVLDELRGTLVLGKKHEELEQNVVLVWVLGDDCPY